jgi:hypothetical protein
MKSLIFLSIAIALVLIWCSVDVEQRAINQQCNTNYSRFDVLLAGDTLQNLCKIKEQQIVLK